MRFKVGDVVEVVNESLRSYGLTGKITEIDEEYEFPYFVKFDIEHKDKNPEDLYLEHDLVLADEEEPTEDKQPRDFIDITFQNGTVLENGVNGAQIEDVIDVLVERLQGFQKGKFPSRENALAITKLEEARMWLNERTRKCQEQGVEGKLKNHE